MPVEVQVPGENSPSERSYSLSGAPDASVGYRLSIKKDQRGLVSRFFHDALAEGSVIRAAKPAGEFVIPSTQEPLVLASAGVGVTPVMAMLHGLQRDIDGPPVWFVHGARNGQEHAFREEAKGLIDRHKNMHLKVFYSSPGQGDLLGADYHQAGRITARDLLDLQAGSRAHYMLCGPAQFLSSIRDGLEDAGVSEDRIHFETFGPGG